MRLCENMSNVAIIHIFIALNINLNNVKGFKDNIYSVY